MARERSDAGGLAAVARRDPVPRLLGDAQALGHADPGDAFNRCLGHALICGRIADGAAGLRLIDRKAAGTQRGLKPLGLKPKSRLALPRDVHRAPLRIERKADSDAIGAVPQAWSHQLGVRQAEMGKGDADTLVAHHLRHLPRHHVPFARRARCRRREGTHGGRGCGRGLGCRSCRKEDRARKPEGEHGKACEHGLSLSGRVRSGPA